MAGAITSSDRGMVTFSAEGARPNLPFRSEACQHIGGEHRFTIVKGATHPHSCPAAMWS